MHMNRVLSRNKYSLDDIMTGVAIAGVLLVAFLALFDYISSRESAEKFHVTYFTRLTTREQCTVNADTILGTMTRHGYATTGHVTRWGEMRRLCFMAVTADHKTANGSIEHMAAVIDVTSSRKIFEFATDRHLDPQQLLRFDRDLDLAVSWQSCASGCPTLSGETDDDRRL